MKYIIPVIIGLVGGLTVGLGVLFIGDSVSPTPAKVADIIEAPVGFLTQLVSPNTPDGTPGKGSIKWFFIFHFAYWAILGAILCIGLWYLRGKIFQIE